MGETNAIDLNQFDLLGRINCPYCNKVMVYSYGAKGRSSQSCAVCKNIVLIDYDRMKAYKAQIRRYTNK